VKSVLLNGMTSEGTKVSFWMEAKSARWSSLETSVLKAERSSCEAASSQQRILRNGTVAGAPEIPDCMFRRVCSLVRDDEVDHMQIGGTSAEKGFPVGEGSKH
jgi:hypothetical protein